MNHMTQYESYDSYDLVWLIWLSINHMNKYDSVWLIWLSMTHMFQCGSYDSSESHSTFILWSIIAAGNHKDISF